VPEALHLAYLDYYTHDEGGRGAPDGDPATSTPRRMYQTAQDAYLAERYGYASPLTGWPRAALAALIAAWPGRRADSDFSVFHLSSRPGGRVLDVGCGSGDAVAALSGKGWDAQGVDIDPVAVAGARAAGRRVEQADVMSCPFPDASFDAVTSSHLLEHVPDPVGLLAEVHRLLRPGGVTVVVTPNADSWLHHRYRGDWFNLDPPRHLQLFRRTVLASLVEDAGFSIRRAFTSVRAANVAAAASRAFRRDDHFDMSAGTRGLGRVLAEVEQQVQALLLKVRPDAGEELVVVAEKT
jgi:SAM-dependent methyltransferase